MDYKSSGVNTELADELVKNISEFSDQIGKFAATCKLPGRTFYDLVMSCDGVGTKTILAKEAKKRFKRPMMSIGYDCVAMVVNDMLCESATPLFFMDYFATNSLDESDYREILNGIHNACKSINVKLIGGETAEMPGMFTGENFDVCGFGVGIKTRQIKHKIREGDVVLGLHSSGVHSNGFSLIRKLIDEETDSKLIHSLLKPTYLYNDKMEYLKKNKIEVKAMAHITGGGFNNINRVLPSTMEVAWKSIDRFYSNQSLFEWIQGSAGLDSYQMRATFNCGIGMMIITGRDNVKNLPLEYEELGTVEQYNRDGA